METVEPRRTQRERRESTRRALLDATVQALVELGYAHTTTTEVVRRAGVSQGALFKHFPTKAALLAAAAEQLFDDLVVTFERAFAEAARSRGEPPIVIAVRELYGIFRSPELGAVYKLYAECATDPELRAALAPVVEAHGRHVRDCAKALFPAIAQSPAHAAAVSTLIYAMQGMTLQRPVHLDADEERSLLAAFETLALQLFPRGEATS